MRSKPYELCAIYKQLWESHPRNVGRTYIIQPRDFKGAKEVADLNDWEELLSVIEPCFNLFIEDQFEGWRIQNYPAWALFQHWSRYLPKIKPKPRPLMIRCSSCGEVHDANLKCNLKEE